MKGIFRNRKIKTRAKEVGMEEIALDSFSLEIPFQNLLRDETEEQGTFHALTLVEGESVLVQSQGNPGKQCKLDFPDTLIVPACMGKYTIVNLGSKPCKVVKALVR